MLALCCLVGPAASGHSFEAQAPPPNGSTSPVDEDTRKQIRELKLKALDAQSAGDLKKELELQKKILLLDPDDARALNRSAEIPSILEKNAAAIQERVLNESEDEAKRKRAQAAIARAEDALIEAKRTGAREPLERAQQSLADARKYARSGDPNLDRLQTLIDQEVAIANRRFWELWGFIGLVGLGLVVALVFYFRRSGRVLEMIEGPQMGQVFRLQKEATALGALASEVDWAIEDPLRKISRRHCDVVRQGRHYFLVDCSTNGTLLNGRPLQKGEPALLKRGDQIGLGGEVTLRFR
jgi:hypothetical protein